MSKTTSQTIHHIAQLANIPVTPEEETKLAAAFDETLAVVEHLSELDTTSTEPTHQVTGLENVMREDVVDPSRMFTQTQALANAAKKHDGFFVVPQLIAQSE